MQLDLFPTDTRLQSIDPARNRRRFYAMSVQRDLFGDWVLVREWGRIGRPGRVRLDHHHSVRAALDAMRALSTQKQRRGYLAR